MLRIRSEQMQALSEQLLRKFEDRLVTHLGEVFPKRCAALGDEKVRAMVKDGTQRAQKYGVVAERDVAMYVDLMLVVRPDFDVARETPWAKPIVGDTALSGPQKVTRLFAEARRNRFRISDEVPAAEPAPAIVGATAAPAATPGPGPRRVTPAPTQTVPPRPPAAAAGAGESRPPQTQAQPQTPPPRRPPPRSFGAVPPL